VPRLVSQNGVFVVDALLHWYQCSWRRSSVVPITLTLPNLGAVPRKMFEISAV